MPKVATTKKATSFGERVCSDNSGRVRTPSLSGCRYLCLVVDEFSAWVWAVPLASLTLVCDTLEKIFAVNLHQRADHTIRFMRHDGGTEYVNSKVTALLRTLGIVSERTCPGTSHQNGKAERHIGILFASMRTLLADARLPAYLWAECLCYIVYVHNRTQDPVVSRLSNYDTDALPQ